MPFIFKRLEIPDVILIEPKIFEDARRFFKDAENNFIYGGKE